MVGSEGEILTLDEVRRLQPRLGYYLQGMNGQVHLLRRCDEGSDVVDGTSRDKKTKIKYARKFFDEMNCQFAHENVKCDVAGSFGKPMELVK